MQCVVLRTWIVGSIYLQRGTELGAISPIDLCPTLYHYPLKSILCSSLFVSWPIYNTRWSHVIIMWSHYCLLCLCFSFDALLVLYVACYGLYTIYLLMFFIYINTNKTDRHDIDEILLKMALNHLFWKIILQSRQFLIMNKIQSLLWKGNHRRFWLSCVGPLTCFLS